MLLNEIALHLCLVVAPLCILAYVYEPTRFVFVNWLKFTTATLFSMVIISVVTVIALRAIIVLIAALIAMDLGNSVASALGVNASLQLRDIATLSGGVGMLLTMLLLSAPPLIFNFFTGSVNLNFSSYNAVGVPVRPMNSMLAVTKHEPALASREASVPIGEVKIHRKL